MLLFLSLKTGTRVAVIEAESLTRNRQAVEPAARSSLVVKKWCGVHIYIHIMDYTLHKDPHSALKHILCNTCRSISGQGER